MNIKRTIAIILFSSLFACVSQDPFHIFQLSNFRYGVINKKTAMLVSRDDCKHILEGLSIASFTNQNNQYVLTDITYAGACSNRLLLIQIDLVAPQNSADIFGECKMFIPLYQRDVESPIETNSDTKLYMNLPISLYHESYLRLTCFENAKSMLMNGQISYYVNIASNSCYPANAVNTNVIDVDVL